MQREELLQLKLPRGWKGSHLAGLSDVQSVEGENWSVTSSLQMQTVKQNPWVGGRCMRKTFQE